MSGIFTFFVPNSMSFDTWIQLCDAHCTQDRSARKCNSGCGTMATHKQVPTQKGKENTFVERKINLGRRA